MGKFGMTPSKEDLNNKVEEIEKVQDKLQELGEDKIKANSDLSSDLVKVKYETGKLSFALIDDLYNVIRENNKKIDEEISKTKKDYRQQRNDVRKASPDNFRVDYDRLVDEEKEAVKELEESKLDKEKVLNDIKDDIVSIFPYTESDVTKEDVEVFIHNYLFNPIQTRNTSSEFIYKTQALSTIANCINLKIDQIDSEYSYKNINEVTSKKTEYSKELFKETIEEIKIEEKEVVQEEPQKEEVKIEKVEEVKKEINQELINKLKNDIEHKTESKPVEKKKEERFVPTTEVDYGHPAFQKDSIIKSFITPEMDNAINRRMVELKIKANEVGEGAPYYNDYQKEIARLHEVAGLYSLSEEAQKNDIAKVNAWQNDPNMSFEEHCEEAIAHMMRGEMVFEIQELYKDKLYEPKNCAKFMKELAEYSTKKELNIDFSKKEYFTELEDKYDYQSKEYMDLSAQDKQALIASAMNLGEGRDLGDAFFETLDKLVDGSIRLSTQPNGFIKTSDSIGKAAEIIFDAYQANNITQYYGGVEKAEDLRKDLNTYIDGAKSTPEMLNKFYKQVGLKDKNDNIAPEKKNEYDSLGLGGAGISTYKRLKEIHEQRGRFFWLAHPRQNWAEYKALKEMRSVLKDKLGVSEHILDNTGRDGKKLKMNNLTKSTSDGVSKLYSKIKDVKQMHVDARREKYAQDDLQYLLEKDNKELGLENALSALANKEVKVQSKEVADKFKEEQKKEKIVISEVKTNDKQKTLENEKKK